MADNEIIHVAIAPPPKLDDNLVRSVATVINKNPYDARLLLAGRIPKIIAHYNNRQTVESVIQKLHALGLAAMACRDAELRPSSPSFQVQTMEFGGGEALFRDNGNHEKKIAADNVFLVLEGKIPASAGIETTKTTTKINLTATLLTGGIPIMRKVNQTTTTAATQDEWLARLYDRKSPEPSVELRQHQMNYSFLGAKIAVSSLANFSTVVNRLRELFPQAIFDDRLIKSFGAISPSRAWEDFEINCRLIYLFHHGTSGD
ncbi:MAG: hypothetical protein HW402_175 [Dehalococcoidales bacterium]|nr:hypothetical protein [Dehalococcoidales bacterium]